MPVIITATDVTNVAPEFTSQAQARIDSFIDIARGFICEEKWGEKAKNAIIFYTAHLLSLASRGASGASGPVTAERVGELSRSYGQISGGSDSEMELSQTPYGLIFISMRKGLLITPLVI